MRLPGRASSLLDGYLLDVAVDTDLFTMERLLSGMTMLVVRLPFMTNPFVFQNARPSSGLLAAAPPPDTMLLLNSA